MVTTPLFTANQVEEGLVDALQSIGLFSLNESPTQIWDLTVKKVREYLATYYATPNVGSSKTDYLKFCTPRRSAIEDAIDSLDFSTLLDVPQNPSCTETSTPRGFWRVPQCGATRIDTFYTWNDDRTALIEVPLTTKAENCMTDQIEWVDRGNSTSMAAVCMSHSQYKCNPREVGNGVCNQECNNAQCHFDGNDCGGTGEVLTYEAMCMDPIPSSSASPSSTPTLAPVMSPSESPTTSPVETVRRTLPQEEEEVSLLVQSNVGQTMTKVYNHAKHVWAKRMVAKKEIQVEERRGML